MRVTSEPHSAGSGRGGATSKRIIFRIRSLLILTICLVLGAAARVQDSAPSQARMVLVFVALADNEHQGIVPVPKTLGNGDDAGRNLYWGAAFGVRTFLKKSGEWKEIASIANASEKVIERSVFYNATGNAYLVADAYRGREIKAATTDFFRAASGRGSGIPPRVTDKSGQVRELPALAELVVYVGHDGLMDFHLEEAFSGNPDGKRQAIILACASKTFFGPTLRTTGAQPLLWTTGLMAPEAYTLAAALDGWTVGEPAGSVRQRAAEAYAKYQRISASAANRLLTTGW